MHPDEPSHVNVVTSTLEGDNTEWLVSLHNEDPPELMNVNALMKDVVQI